MHSALFMKFKLLEKLGHYRIKHKILSEFSNIFFNLYDCCYETTKQENESLERMLELLNQAKNFNEITTCKQIDCSKMRGLYDKVELKVDNDFTLVASYGVLE